MTDPNHVHNARRACGLSQEAFAAKLGITQGEIARWESGKRKPGRLVVLLMKLAIADPEHFVEHTDQIQGLALPPMTIGPKCDEAMIHAPYVTINPTLPDHEPSPPPEPGPTEVVPLTYINPPEPSVLTEPYVPAPVPMTLPYAPPRLDLGSLPEASDDEPEPEPTVEPVVAGRTLIGFSPNSWEGGAEDDEDEDEVTWVGDGPPPHGRAQGAGAYDRDMGYLGGQEEDSGD